MDEANGVSCLACSWHEDSSDPELDAGEPCPDCGEPLVPALIEPCELGKECEDDLHDYGSGNHVKELHNG